LNVAHSLAAAYGHGRVAPSPVKKKRILIAGQMGGPQDIVLKVRDRLSALNVGSQVHPQPTD